MFEIDETEDFLPLAVRKAHAEDLTSYESAVYSDQIEVSTDESARSGQKD